MTQEGGNQKKRILNKQNQERFRDGAYFKGGEQVHVKKDSP